MKIVEVQIESITPYSASRKHDTPKQNEERPDAYEKRTWREKSNTDTNGIIVIPAMAFKQALDSIAKFRGQQIPGKGKSTFTKHFASGVICESDVPLGVRKDEAESVTINANSDGVRGSGKRVQRTFPVIPKWSSTARFVIFDDVITEEIFERHLQEAGAFIGVGRFRPQNGGLNGRFRCVKFTWLKE